MTTSGPEASEHLILGASLRGLQTALALDSDRRLVVEALPEPGGTTATQRSNGFACELGRFAFAPDEVEPLLARLPSPPTPIPAATTTGHMFDGDGLVEAVVEPVPLSFASGCAEIVQQSRRALGPALRLGRRVEVVRPLDDGWQIELAGEVPATLCATRLEVCLPVDAAARLFAEFDPALVEMSQYLVRAPHAFAFLGGLASDCGSLQGYGIVPGADVASPIAETIFCSNAFAARCLPDRFLLRSELVGPEANGSDDEVLALATAELQRWTGHGTAFGFTKVHRFTRLVADAAWAECQARLQGLAIRCGNLHFA